MSLDDMLPEKRTRKPPPSVDLPPLTNMNSDEDIDASMPDGPHDRSKGTTTPVGSDVGAMAASVSQLTPSCSKRPPSPPPSAGVGSGGNLGQLSSTSSGDPIVTLFPRRKAGQIKPSGGRGPVVLNLETLEQYYGVPLHVAAKKLGICQTAIKKVCRRLGIKKWPYKEMRLPATKDEDSSDSGNSSPTDVSTTARRYKIKPEHDDENVKDAVAALLTLIHA